MKKLIVFLPILFLVSPAFADNTVNFCVAPNVLNSTTATYVNGTLNHVSSNTTCPYGCVGLAGAARCSNNPALMPIELYIFLAAAAFLFLIMSFKNFGSDREMRYVAIFPWLSFFLSLVLSLSSVNLLIGGEQFESGNMTIFWGGMSVLMFSVAMYMTFIKAKEQIEDSVKGL